MSGECGIVGLVSLAPMLVIIPVFVVSVSIRVMRAGLIVQFN